MAAEPYLVLARKYRPQTFEEVVGQEHITRTLQNAIAAGRLGHAFLFIGSRGIGKTTSARILAKALNCESFETPTPNPCLTCDNCQSIARGNSIDVIEIDGASNNSVDDVRQIRENVQLVPSRSRYKIYIIDEVHQLSTGAFNALLKTLEEPPSHAVFILATTEAHKVPATIVSRCQRHDFRRAGIADLEKLLVNILEAEGISYETEAIQAIARAADGGIRDSESILDQVISYCGEAITYQAVYEVLGLVDWKVLHELCDAMLAKDVSKQLAIVEDVSVSGKDLPQFMEEILRYYRNLLVCKTAGDDASKLLPLPPEELEALHFRAQRFSLTELIRLVEQFAELFKRDFDMQLAPRIALETLLIRLSKVASEVSVDTVMEKLVQLGAGGTGQRDSGSPVAHKAPANAPPGTAPLAAERASGAPNPPEPLPAPHGPQPAEAAKKARVTLPDENLDGEWQRLIAEAQEDKRISLKLGIALASAKAVSRDEGILTLEAPPGHALTWDQLSSVTGADDVRDFFRRCVENVHDFALQQAAPPDSVAGAPPSKARSHGTHPGVPEEEAARLLKDPTVAAVLDVFKGKIIAVRRPPLPEPTSETAEADEPAAEFPPD